MTMPCQDVAGGFYFPCVAGPCGFCGFAVCRIITSDVNSQSLAAYPNMIAVTRQQGEAFGMCINKVLFLAFNSIPGGGCQNRTSAPLAIGRPGFYERPPDSQQIFLSSRICGSEYPCFGSRFNAPAQANTLSMAKMQSLFGDLPKSTFG